LKNPTDPSTHVSVEDDKTGMYKFLLQTLHLCLDVHIAS
jgi:hypothetical protein